MIRMYIAFFIVFAIFYFGIDGYRKLTGKEKWALTKLLAYSILCTVLAVSILSAIVILF